MTFIARMNNSASPQTQGQGIGQVDARNLENWPRGTASRRRGFQEYVAAALSGSIYDLGVYDRITTSGVHNISLVGRHAVGAAASLWSNTVYSGTAESTANAWASLGSGWTAGAQGGQCFGRNEFLYYSDGTTKKGWEETTSFTIGLTTPTGIPNFALVTTTDGRAEPGWYDYTYVAYEADRNVHSLPLGFVTPGTMTIGGTAMNQITSHYSLGFLPNLNCSFEIGKGSVSIDGNASHYELYRRHPLNVYLRPARRIDDVRMVSRQAVATGSVTDRLNDYELGDRLTYAGSTVPAWRAVCEQGQRWYYVPASQPWKLWFSELDAPENVAQELTIDTHQIKPFLEVETHDGPRTGEGWTRVGASAGAKKTALPEGDSVIILCENEVWVKVGNAPRNFWCAPLDTTIGCTSAKGAVATPFGLFWWSPGGPVWKRQGERPVLISQNWLDFDSSTSPVRMARTAMGNIVAAYDPERKQVEWAIPAYGSTGNDLIICLDVELSTTARPVFTYHVPVLASGETITSMTTLHLPVRPGFIVYGTSKGRIMYRSGATDDDNAAQQPIEWRLRGWAGQQNVASQKSHLGIALMQSCAYTAAVDASAWSMPTMAEPAAGETLNMDAATIVCGATMWGQQELAVGGRPFYFLSLRESASSPFQIHELSPWGQVSADWPAGDKKRL